MHETIVAQSVVNTILAETEKVGKKPVSATISCGQLNPINDHVMEFAFENAVKDTICEGMKLEVLHNPCCALQAPAVQRLPALAHRGRLGTAPFVFFLCIVFTG